MVWIRNEYRKAGKKKCLICGQVKRLEFFYYNKTHNTHSSNCKRCQTSKLRDERTGSQTPRWFKHKYDKLRNASVMRGCEFSLTLEDFKRIRVEPCFYCDNTYPVMTVDKVDPSRGYSADNCVSACHNCNRNKGAVTIDMCKKILAFVGG